MRRTQFWNSLALTGMLALAGLVPPVGAQDPDDLKRGVASLCIGGGEATAMAIERA